MCTSSNEFVSNQPGSSKGAAVRTHLEAAQGDAHGKGKGLQEFALQVVIKVAHADREPGVDLDGPLFPHFQVQPAFHLHPHLRGKLCTHKKAAHVLLNSMSSQGATTAAAKQCNQEHTKAV
eukprot:574077-Pelagomonas_calceolata.AAC.5